MAETIIIRMDKDRLLDEVTVDEYIAMTEGDLRVIKKVLSNFVVSPDGSYYPVPEGAKIIGKLPMRKILEMGQEFSIKAEDTVVPK